MIFFYYALFFWTIYLLALVPNCDDNLPEDHISYLAAISACGKAQRWTDALLNFQQLQRSMAVPQNVMNSATWLP